MALQTNASVMASKLEIIQGVPVSPTAGTDFIALQSDFSVTPSFNNLESAELTGSIGKAKGVKGIEEPTVSMSHYLRASGTEGTAPDYADFLVSAFGSTAARATQRSTTTGSTVSAVILSTGGSEFQRGDAILVKHASNTYEIRNVLSVSTNTLTLAQNLLVAPLTGVGTGKNVAFRPENSGHPTHTLWFYMGNVVAGAVQMMAGARCVSMNTDITAGEFISTSFSLEGTSYFYDPIEIAATDIYLDFDDGTARAAALTAKMYKDPYELAEAIQAAMQALTGDVITVSYNDSTGKYTIASTGVTLSLLWNTGVNTANTIGDKIGFLTAADDTAALTYTSDNAVSKAAPYTPSYNAADPLVAKSNEVLFGSLGSQVTCFQAATVSISLENSKQNLISICADSGVAASVFSGRTVSVQLKSLVDSHQAEFFRNFRKNQKVLFTYNGGEKSGGNWVPGKCINMHSPTMVIDEVTLTDESGLVGLDLKLSAYVESGLGEFYLNFL